MASRRTRVRQTKRSNANRERTPRHAEKGAPGEARPGWRSLATVAAVGLTLGVASFWILHPTEVDSAVEPREPSPVSAAGLHVLEQGVGGPATNPLVATNASAVPAVDEEPTEARPRKELEEAFGNDGYPRTLPTPTYHPRPVTEWQGMLVNTSFQPGCAASDMCGLGMACIRDRCGPCSQDSDCASGEACVLDHCVVASNADCRVSSDCELDEMCVLSGYSARPRGNEEMVAFCQSSSAVEELEDLASHEAASRADPGPPAAPRPVSLTALQSSIPADALDLDVEAEDADTPETQETPEAEPFDEELEEDLFEQGDPDDLIDEPGEHEPIIEVDTEETEPAM